MWQITFLVSICTVVAAFDHDYVIPEEPNNRPIIGVLALDLSVGPLKEYGNYKSHIAASYVKYLESAGARVVPILPHKKPSYYEKMAESVNGVFFPGALAYSGAYERGLLENHGIGYGLSVAQMYNYALRQNAKGIYFPVWGTCLGFQLLTFFASGGSPFALGIRKKCNSDNQIIPLEITEDAGKSRMFGNASDEIMQILKEENVTAHYHNYCITKETMSRAGLLQWWHVLSLNHDFNGMEFVSTIEAKGVPFYGSIYHPEKNGFEWVETEHSPHDAKAITMMQYFANFFVNEARKNNNSFETAEEERKALIYNYPTTYTGDKTVYQQVYFFE